VQPTRRDFARPRRRRIRLVTPAMARETPIIPEHERQALDIGLRFAGHLRRLFPAFYAEHVAKRRTTFPNLLGTCAAFLSLAHKELLTLDLDAIRNTPGMFWNTGRLPFAIKQPAHALLYPNHGDAMAVRLLTNDGREWLFTPAPRVYGLSVEAVTTAHHRWMQHPDGRTIDRDMLALVIWRMLGLTSWSPLGADRTAEIAADRARDVEVGRAVAVLPTIPTNTPLVSLCAYLDRERPRSMGQLGTLIAYICGRTGNGFADTSTGEARARYDTIVDLDWERPASAFGEARSEQQWAANVARSYSHWCGRFVRNAQLLLDIRAAILEAAGAVADGTDALDTYDSRALFWRTA
jgi:hypothetical protein